MHEPLEVALEHAGSLSSGIEIVDGGLHRISSPDIFESYQYRYAIQVPHKEINPASIIEPVRQASVVAIKERFMIASEPGADVIINAGFVSMKEDMPYARSQLSRSLQELTTASHEYGVSFAVTNAGRWDHACIRTPADLSLLGPVSLALNLSHAHQNGCLPGFLAKSASRHIYLHDNNGISPGILEVGTGTIPFHDVARTCHANSARGVVHVPSYQAAYNSIRALHRYGIR